MWRRRRRGCSAKEWGEIRNLYSFFLFILLNWERRVASGQTGGIHLPCTNIGGTLSHLHSHICLLMNVPHLPPPQRKTKNTHTQANNRLTQGRGLPINWEAGRQDPLLVFVFGILNGHHSVQDNRAPCYIEGGAHLPHRHQERQKQTQTHAAEGVMGLFKQKGGCTLCTMWRKLEARGVFGGSAGYDTWYLLTRNQANSIQSILEMIK